MKNKYQEAFKRLKNDIERGNCDYNVEPYLNILQELVDKETPMKVIANPSGKSKRYKYLCPNCKDYLFEANSQTMRFMKDEKRYNHCAYCGQKIDWSDNDED